MDADKALKKDCCNDDKKKDDSSKGCCSKDSANASTGGRGCCASNGDLETADSHPLLAATSAPPTAQPSQGNDWLGDFQRRGVRVLTSSQVDFFGFRLPPYAVGIVGLMVFLWFSLKGLLIMCIAWGGFRFWSRRNSSGRMMQGRGGTRRGGGGRRDNHRRGGGSNIRGIGDLPKPVRRG